MKTKLAYFCSSTSWGGLEMNHLRNALWMKERGHDVVFFGVKDSPIESDAIEKNIPFIAVEKQKKYYDFKRSKELAHLLSKNNVTHLIIRSTYDMSIAASVKKILKQRIHTSYFMEMQLGVKKTNFFHSLRFAYFDLWSCPLNWLQKQVKKMTHFRNELIVIPSGIDLKKFSNLPSKEDCRKELQIPQGELTFGLIGRFDVQKGQLLLLEAMEICPNKNFNVVLLGEPTIGEGDTYFNQMKEVISHEELKNRVFLKPYRKDTGIFYKAIDWMVMATKAETFGMVTVESIACGTPVLGSNAGGTPEIIQNGDNGRLFETLNAKDLAKQIENIINQKVQLNSDELINQAKVYDHQTVCQSVEKALNI